MRIGICTSLANSSVVKAAGGDFVEANVQGFLVPQKGDDEFAPNREAVATNALPVAAANCFLPGSLKCVGPEVRTEKILEYAATAFARAKEAGIGVIVFGSGGSRRLPEGFPRDKATDQFASLLTELGPIAEPNGVTVAVEALNSGECNFINSLAEAGALVRRADHPNVRLLVDIYHMLTDGEPPEEVARHAELVAHCHVAESSRRAPGTGPEDLRPFLRPLAEAGYEGCVSMECKWEDLESEAAGAVECLREQIADVAP
ncbi:MAG: sugar phosphate isomerase/epimerase family protein [Planctomycetota bacterium]|jgi:sugar phosphate isomerase/epimerase